MKKIYIFTLLLVIITSLFGIYYYQKGIKTSSNQIKNGGSSFPRIISLSPNVTEILFALGLGEKIVGVTRFCNYPPEAKEKMKVGGYLDPNYEAILSLKPDIVILLSEFKQTQKLFSELGIKYTIVNNRTIQEILASIKLLGKEFGVERQAEELLISIRLKIKRIEEKTKNSNRPRVIIVVERTIGTGAIENVYVAGLNTFYDELIRMAGGINAFKDKKVAYPILSAEGIIHLNPDFIIDLVPQLGQTALSVSLLLNDWQCLSQLDAVQKHHVYILSQDYAVIPGPRFILFLEDLSRMIHPEIDWNI